MPASARRCPIESLSAADGPGAPLPGALALRLRALPGAPRPCLAAPSRAGPGPREGRCPLTQRGHGRGPRGGPAEPAPPFMATGPPCLWLCLAGLLSLRAGSALPLRDPRDEVLAAALQRLREVFDIEELPPDVLPRKKPPQFMVDLFNKVADANGITRAPGLLQGDVVRGFEDRVHVDHHHFYFDISAMERGEQMLKAEFRVFKLKRTHRSRRSDVRHFCKVEVYELLESGNKPQKKHLIASRLLSLYAEGWEVFNVTQTVSKWVGNSSSNHGFWITTTLVSSNGVEHDVVTFAKSQGALQESRKALLVLFTNSNKRRSHSFVPSATRAEPNPARSDAPRAPHDAAVLAGSSAGVGRRPRAAAARPLTACHRRELYVDFQAIGWSGWIIHPSGYNAFYCRGSCIFPLGESLNATNHATVQSIVYTLKLSQEVSMPCCVPDELKSLNLLYFDDKQNVVLKNYKDMVATRCGCH
ncbi:bone morphogenetic protein 2-like isoform X2 [Prinia subflava]|uniref:bone morphogenetic protein 2-like isoform X2 n=1 Tax=Prinia subflava TaxID=208062 RepID=UPI002FE20BD9